MTDYKGVQFSFEGKRRHERVRLLRRFIAIAVGLGLIGATLLWWQRRDLQERMNALLSESIAPQAFRASLPGFRLFPDARSEAVAISWCLEDGDQGSQLLNRIRQRSSFFKPGPILDRLIERASPAPFISYARFLEKHNCLSAYYGILFRLASYQTVTDAEIQTGLAELGDKEKIDQIGRQIRTLNQELGRREVVAVRDRDDRTLAVWSLSERRLVEKLPGFSLSRLQPLFQDGYRQIRLSLSLKLQNHADSLFDPHYGSLVLLDLENGSILAAYSKPSPGAAKGNSALEDTFEPGSIVKLLTQFIYDGQKRKSLFPFHCAGSMTVDNRLFYDWTRHDTLESVQEAMAMSCNLVFARMGMELGAEPLRKGLGDFFFDRPEPWRDGPFTLQPGHTRQPQDRFALANLSIGLEEIRISTVHAALIAGLIAGNGILPSPHILASSSNLLGLVISRSPAAAIELQPRCLQYLTLQQSMAMAVDHARGTARRAQNDRFTLAAKTGTSGDSAQGLDAVIIAYFPRSNPRYALAFRLEHGGKAEYTGALFLKRYLETFPR